jgi:hypothetical protein
MTPALKTRILGNIAMAEANKARVAAPLIEHESVEPGEPAQHSSQSTLTNGSSVSQEPPSSSPVPDDDISDGLSYTSSISDFFDVGNDDSGQLATGPWTIIDHFTGDMIVDEEEVPPAPPAASAALFDSTIQVQINPTLGIYVLVETSPPTLLFTDKDERPNWLVWSTSEFLQHAPYYMCLNKVVDLFFAQEARLGYPDKASKHSFSLFIRSLTMSFANHHSPCDSPYRPETGLPKLLCL